MTISAVVLHQGPSPRLLAPSPILVIRPEKLIGTDDESIAEHSSAAKLKATWERVYLCVQLTLVWRDQWMILHQFLYTESIVSSPRISWLCLLSCIENCNSISNSLLYCCSSSLFCKLVTQLEIFLFNTNSDMLFLQWDVGVDWFELFLELIHPSPADIFGHFDTLRLAFFRSSTLRAKLLRLLDILIAPLVNTHSANNSLWFIRIGNIYRQLLH